MGGSSGRLGFILKTTSHFSQIKYKCFLISHSEHYLHGKFPAWKTSFSQTPAAFDRNFIRMKIKNQTIKTVFYLLFWMTLYGSSGIPARAAPSPAGIFVSYLEDNALFRTGPNAPWAQVVIGQTLYPKYEIKTLPLTRVTLRLADGSEVRIAPNSHLRINPQTDAQVSRFDLQLLLGKAWAKFRKNVKLGAKLILRTAQAKINVRGTSYETSVAGDETQVRVFHGEVAVSNNMAGNQNAGAPTEIAPPHEVSREEWQVIVTAFYTISVRNNQPTKPQAFRLDAVQNSWIDWNLEQDQDI